MLTVPRLVPRLRATSRWLRPTHHFCRRISRVFRMEACQLPLLSRGAGVAHCPESPRARPAPLYAWRARGYHPVHDPRSTCSRWPIHAFTMSDLCVHDQPIPVFTIVRNAHSLKLRLRRMISPAFWLLFPKNPLPNASGV